MNDGFWIDLEVANTPANHLRSTARAIDYLHWALDVIPEVDATTTLREFSRIRREGKLNNSHEAFVNEVVMYAELRSVRPRWGEDSQEWLRWQWWARRYRNAPFSTTLGPHNARPGTRGTFSMFPQALITLALHPSWALLTTGRCLRWTLLTLIICHKQHMSPLTIRSAAAGPL